VKSISPLAWSIRTKVLALAVVVALIGAVAAVLVVDVLPLHAQLAMAAGESHVRATDPVTVRFNRDVDVSHVSVEVKPTAALTIKRLKDRLVLVPADRWQAAQTYEVLLGDVPDSTHTATLKGWHATFKTQPHVGVASIKADGKVLKNGAVLRPHSKVTLAFTMPMRTASITPMINQQAVSAGAYAWSKDGTGLDLTLPATLVPYEAFQLTLGKSGFAADGDMLTDVPKVSLSIQAVMPSNSGSVVPADFKPIAVVVENAPGSHPHAGLQQADIVYEYISEYSIGRMTAIYFGKLPSEIGSVRSCRLINTFLTYAYAAPVMCSGMSGGTQWYFQGQNGHPVSSIVNDSDSGGHFYRVGSKAAPHNLYTDADRVARARTEVAGPSAPQYMVDPPHPDVPMGQAAAAPSVDLHGISYTYDASNRDYLRFDRGEPSADGDTNAQIAVKNVVVMHVGYELADYVEDVNGGAPSVRYFMNGLGPAEIWSNGSMIHATWHEGAVGQDYFYNHAPVWFTDDQGNVLELNTGLTWIHVLGNGQTS